MDRPNLLKELQNEKNCIVKSKIYLNKPTNQCSHVQTGLLVAATLADSVPVS